MRLVSSTKTGKTVLIGESRDIDSMWTWEWQEGLCSENTVFIYTQYLKHRW